MNTDFITLWKLGVGPIVVRHSDIMSMELTPYGFTRIEFGYGDHIIVEQQPLQILALIEGLEDLAEQAEEIKKNATANA